MVIKVAIYHFIKGSFAKIYFNFTILNYMVWEFKIVANGK